MIPGWLSRDDRLLLAWTLGVKVAVLDSGFRVRYHLELSHRLLRLTHMQPPQVQAR